MKRYSKGIFIVVFSVISFLSQAQDCHQYHIDHCRWADRTFLYSRQSRSAQFTPGMTSKFSVVVYGGEEYYVSVDGHRKLGNVRLRIYEDDESQTILYDNAEFKYEEFFYFKVSNTRKLLIEITTPKAEDTDEKNKYYCVGVLILFRDTSSPSDKSKQDVGF